jgi:hypothetical protein
MISLQNEMGIKTQALQVELPYDVELLNIAFMFSSKIEIIHYVVLEDE